jgi:hypothetical protein
MILFVPYGIQHKEVIALSPCFDVLAKTARGLWFLAINGKFSAIYIGELKSPVIPPKLITMV